MGAACCKIFSGSSAEPKEANNKTKLIQKDKQLVAKQHTSNDKEFTYFLQAFQLGSCGQTLKTPEYIDQQNPNFSYSAFNQLHRRYYNLVKQLGRYIENRSNPSTLVFQKTARDTKMIEQIRKKLGFGKSRLQGCMVKLEIQAVGARDVEAITITHDHPQEWKDKFKDQVKISQIQTEPKYFQFVVPQILSSSIKIATHPRKLQLVIHLSESFEQGKLTFCEVLPLKGAQGQGVALRMQIFAGKDEEEKLKEMVEVHRSLMREFEGEQLMESRDEATKEEIASKLSRHRSSLAQQYNLNNNSMF